MSYSPKLGSAFNKTRLRDPEHPTTCSGMCSVCGECPGLCEIGLAAVRGADTVYPTAGGIYQYGSEKDYPVDLSHFNINGRVFGAVGAPECSAEATVFHVKMETEIGRRNPIKLKLPVVLPAMAKLAWPEYFGGAAMAGVLAVIGEGAIDKDPNLVCENAKVKECQLLKDMIGAFRKYDHGYGQIILQVNCDDDIRGVAEYGLTECGATAIEFKFGQSAKGIQAMGIVEGLDKALKMKKNGNLILPDPEDPEVQKEYLAGRGPHFRDYNRLPMWTEEYLCGRIEELRKRVDSLVIIPNERLKHATDQKITFANAFEIADDVLRQAVQSISDLIRDTGFINLDFADVTAIMKNAGMAHMGVGRAAGKGKAEEAAKMAISSPLLETSIEGAKGVLINVTGSMDIGLEEVEQAATLVQQAVHPDALTIFGATFDEELDDEIRVTVIATGFDKVPEQLPKVPPIQAGAAGQQSAAAEPMPLKEEDVPKPEEPEDDPFEDIFKIFNKRD